VILIALVWILTALSVIALSFSRESFVEVAAARNARDLADGYYIARAGIAHTIYKLIEKRQTGHLRRLELQGPPDPIDLGQVTGEFGDGVYDVEIQDESAKINLNFVAEEQLHNLMDVLGIDKREGDVIVDSLMDWRDVDNAHRVNGAEDDYYQSLDPPYKAKNGRLETMEELLLVRGMTRPYYYGFPEKSPDGAPGYRYGLSRYVTVYSSSIRINVNFAPVEVLMSIPGMTAEIAQAIFEHRKTKPFTNVGEITRDLPVTMGPMTMPYLSTDVTGIYTLTASGHRQGSRVQRLIRTVVSLNEATATSSYKFIYWNENVPNL
jgi:general secretion pathway protein K